MKIETDKIIKYLEEIVEHEEWTFTSHAEQKGQWYDKWEQGDREAQGYSEGHSDGYCKAMNEVIELLKKEKQ